MKEEDDNAKQKGKSDETDDLSRVDRIGKEQKEQSNSRRGT